MNDRPVYCICREEERPGMIGCDYCDEWYHTQCLSLSKEEVKRLANENWSCPNCEFKKVKSKRQSSTTEASKNPPRFSNQGVTPNEPKSGLHDVNEDIKCGAKPSCDAQGMWKTASPTIKRKVKQVSDVVTPQRNKRKRLAQPNEEALHREENMGTQNQGNKEHQTADAKKMRVSLIVKSPKEQIQKELETPTHSNEAHHANYEDIVSLTLEQDDNIQRIMNKDTKFNNENGYGIGGSNKYQLTNKRMTVPLQKRPKKSFEEALFGAASPVINTKRHAAVGEEISAKPLPKRSLDKGDVTSDGCLSSADKKPQVTERNSPLGPKKSQQSLSNRTTSVQSRAADDENSSPTVGTPKAKKLKKRSEFPKDRNIESTTSTQESSEDHGPLSPPSPTSAPPVVLENNITPHSVLGKVTQVTPRMRSISSSST